jgi:hypothetical protein
MASAIGEQSAGSLAASCPKPIDLYRLRDAANRAAPARSDRMAGRLHERFRAALDENHFASQRGVAWTWERCAGFAKRLRGHRQPDDWPKLAEVCARAGLTDARGQTPDARTAQET